MSNTGWWKGVGEVLGSDEVVGDCKGGDGGEGGEFGEDGCLVCCWSFASSSLI